ncbi:unnamed protein product [Alternaria alternata]
MSKSVPQPRSAASAPATMLLDQRPTQDEANNEIDDWLLSCLQSYVEEGQRMRDAADDTPPRMHERLRNAQVDRPVIINGEGHSIHINCGPGQQNVYYSKSRDGRDNYDDEGYDDDGYSDDGYDNDYDYGDDEENVPGYDVRYQQSGRSRDTRDNGRFHDGYDNHTCDRHMPYCECRDCQPDLTPDDGSSSSGYSDHW